MSFIVSKENIGTIEGTQKEFNGCARRGIGFAAGPALVADHRVWHYLFPAEKLESSIKKFIGKPEDQQFSPEFYIWSQEVTIGAVLGDPLISPYYGGYEEWEEEANDRFQAARGPVATQPILEVQQSPLGTSAQPLGTSATE